MSRERRDVATKFGVLLAFGTASTGALAGDGFYAGVNVGATFPESQDVTITYETQTVQDRNGNFADIDLDDGLLGGVTLGYAYSWGLRPELSFDRRSNDLKSVTLPVSGLLGGQGGPATNVNGEEVVDTGMANIWFDLFKQGRLHPYIGAGAGFARLHLRDVRYNNVNIQGKHDTVFAYQAGAGIGFDVTDHFTVSVDYRYLITDDGEFDPLATGSPSKIELKYEASEVVLGIRYSFGGKPEEAAETPVEETSVEVVEPVEGTPVPEEVAPTPAPAEKACEAPKPGERISLEGCKTGDTLVLRGVTFEFNKATLTPDAKTILDEVADELVARGDIKIEVDGHTDAKGSDSYNLDLSQSRADAVKAYLGEHGVDVSRMVANGFGESQPIADNDSDAGRELNRRVELKITGSEAATDSPSSESSSSATTTESAPVDIESSRVDAPAAEPEPTVDSTAVLPEEGEAPPAVEPAIGETPTTDAPTP